MASSAFFSVKLPSTLTDSQFVKVYEWGKQHCLHANLVRQDNGYLLIAQRAEERDLRSRQRLMLTNLKNWVVDTSQQPKGWCAVLTAEEFNAYNRSSSAVNEQVEDNEEEKSEQQLEEPIAYKDKAAHAKVQKASQPTTASILTSSCGVHLELPPCLITAPVVKTS